MATATTLDETTTATTSERLAVFDADAHFTEPPDLWTSRAPASWRDRMPAMFTVDGNTGWFIEGEPWATTGGNTIQTGAKKVLGTHVVQPFEVIDRSAYSVKERLALMDDMGVWAQVIYPNGIGFASNHVFAIKDEEQRAMVLRTFNDFYVDIHQEGGGRLLPQAMLPIWDMDFTIKEMTRMLEAGITGFTLSDKPELLGLPELPRPYFEPMWDLFNESGAVANFHIGAGQRREDLEAIRGGRDAKNPDGGGEIPTVAPAAWNSLSRQRRLAVGATQMYMSNVRIITNFCLSDIFERYNKLKIVSAESGIGWIPFVLEAMEFQLDEMVTLDVEVAQTSRRPTELFRDHFSVMYWFEKLAPATLIEEIGVKNVLVETDVPHPTCLYPSPVAHFDRVMKDVDPYVRRRVMQDNGAELYGIELPDWAPRD
jgi:uncharacterized protein